jgi:heptosyltransferase II
VSEVYRVAGKARAIRRSRFDSIPRFVMAQRILFFSPSWLGDAVMALPTLNDLARAFPAARIGVVARASVADLFRAAPAASDILVYRRTDGLAKPLRYAEFIGKLRAFAADLALILPRSFGAGWTGLLSDATRRVGYRAAGRGLLLSDVVEREPALLRGHRVHYYRNLLSVLGIEAGTESPRIVVPPAEKASAREFLKPLLELDPARIVGLIPGAQYGSAKQWPEERFAALALELLNKRNAKVVLLGGPGDRDVCDRIRHEADPARVLDLSGRTSILELAGVLELCRFVVSNDTGAMHVAAAVSTPVIAIFGSTDPVTTAPFGGIHTILREPVECSPCLLRTCPIDHRCMRRIDVERVFESCSARLD